MNACEGAHIPKLIIKSITSHIFVASFLFNHLIVVNSILVSLDAPSVSVHLANEEPIPSRLIIRPERDNVTLKCRADANPPVDINSFGWYKNVRKMKNKHPFSNFIKICLVLNRKFQIYLIIMKRSASDRSNKH